MRRSIAVCCSALTIGLGACGGAARSAVPHGAQASGGAGGTGGTGGSSGAGGSGGSGGSYCQPVVDLCTGDDICVYDECVPVFPGKYDMRVLGTVSEHTLGGDDWDPNGGLPDPYIVVRINGSVVLRTAPASNTSQTTAGTTIDLSLADEPIELEMWDWDGDEMKDDRIIIDCPIQSLTAAAVRVGVICEWDVDGQRTFLTAAFSPDY